MECRRLRHCYKHCHTYELLKRICLHSSRDYNRVPTKTKEISMLHILVALFLLPLAQAQAETASASDIQAGKEIWQGYFGLENDCKLCHGDHGDGGFAKPLAGHQLSAAQLLRTVRQGAGKTMP